jgi:glycosyltransferase involved in cell wall biosynthesis
LILSSEFEGLPTVLIEALILGTTVISSDCKSGPGEIMTGALAEYLVPVNDAERLSMMMKTVYATPYPILASTVKKFIPEKIFQDYNDLLN